ncbi:MAG: hypothetical protein U1E13_05640, partial [Methylophilaceae bacterium]|nr:hypothetical protein [Methylophilaceae bacterium]
MNLSDFLLTLLSTAGASVLLSGALIFLLRNWISDRLQQSIKYEYDQKLANLNAQLRNEADKNALFLKNSIEREAEKLRFANNSISEIQKAA